MKDEMGFDPDETYTQPDNPFWDSTDGAHPAWWRGNDAGFRATFRKLEAAYKHTDELYTMPAPGEFQKLLEELSARPTGYEGGVYEGTKQDWVNRCFASEHRREILEGALEDILTADDTSTLAGALAVARDGLDKARRPW